MSFPVAPPDRRLFSRRKCAMACVVNDAHGLSVPGVLRQRDPIGARLQLPGVVDKPSGDLRIVLDDGEVLYGLAAWRLGDVVGVKLMRRALKSSSDAARSRLQLEFA